MAEYVSLLLAVVYVASIVLAFRLLRRWRDAGSPVPRPGRDRTLALGLAVVAVVMSAPLLIVLYGLGKGAQRVMDRRRS